VTTVDGDKQLRDSRLTDYRPEVLGPPVSRRGFLAGAGTVALGLTLGACGGSSSTSGALGKPKRGGTLTVAITGGGSADTLDPFKANAETDYCRAEQLYESLTRFDASGQLRNYLAEEMTPNKTGTLWTIRVRDGVHFHDGRPLTAADVMASLRLMGKAPSSAGLMTPLDLNGMKALDTKTVSVPAHSPLFTFPAIVGGFWGWVVPANYNPARPNGTGPFVAESFTPGVQSTFKRNPNYWQSGRPYVDKIVITDYSDETSQVNALTSGQANCANDFSLASVRVLKGAGVKILAGEGGVSPFFMRVDTAPFSDVRVRQALKLVVDRPQMLKTVFGEYGSLGNDVFAPPFDPLYASLPQRNQDLAGAKSLLRQAGHSGLTVTLSSSPVAQGLVETGQVFAQQAKGAGINVRLAVVPVAVHYGPNFLKWPFTQEYLSYDQYLVQVANSMLPSGSLNESHFANPRYVSLYNQAVAAADTNLRKELAAEMQRIEYDEGPCIIPYFTPTLDGYASSVHGLQAGKIGFPFGQFTFFDAWIE